MIVAVSFVTYPIGRRRRSHGGIIKSHVHQPSVTVTDAVFLTRFEGGPLNGRVVTWEDVAWPPVEVIIALHTTVAGWLPLMDRSGVRSRVAAHVVDVPPYPGHEPRIYRQRSRSELPDQEFVVRGAIYEYDGSYDTEEV